MGGGGGACLILWPRGWALIRGRALIRAWALIRGNTVSEILSDKKHEVMLLTRCETFYR